MASKKFRKVVFAFVNFFSFQTFPLPLIFHLKSKQQNGNYSSFVLMKNLWKICEINKKSFRLLFFLAASREAQTQTKV